MSLKPGQGLVGRESELEAVEAFLASDGPPQALLLVGDPGIGKTTLWEAGLAAASDRGFRVLRARPSDAEARLSFAALTDLLDEIDVGGLRGLPHPQQSALEVALVRTVPDTVAPDPHVIALGVFNALRALTADGPLLVAVDDIQWLDGPSGEALAFAARRLESHPVRFLLAKRRRTSSVLEKALVRVGMERLEIAPLSLGAVRRLLFERLGLTLRRRTLRRVFDATSGNPLFALELGRTLAEQNLREIGEDIPVPEAVEELLGTRVAELAAPLRRFLLALSLSGELRTAQLTAIASQDVVDEAVATGLVRLDGERVRSSHPLLAAGARKHSSPDERRAAHRTLAETVADPELRAHHLALAAQGPDAELAGVLEAAAVRASTRGAAAQAAELAEHALRLTPSNATERTERVLMLARYLEVADRSGAAIELLTPEMARFPRGRQRGRAYLLMAEMAMSLDAHESHLDRAFEESEDDPLLRGRVLANKSATTSVVRVARIADAEAWADEALSAASHAATGDVAKARYALAWARILRGRPIEDLRERFPLPDGPPHEVFFSLDRVAAIRQAWRGENREAEATFNRLFSRAEEHGEGLSYLGLRLQLCELALRTGDTATGSALLEEWGQSDEEGAMSSAPYLRCRALHAALRGLPDEADAQAGQAIKASEESGELWNSLEALRARGIAALFAHEPQRAVESLHAVWEHTRREGVDDPGAFPVAPDLVEALVELGKLDEALEISEGLSALATEQQHPWGLATTLRSKALIRLASGSYDEEATADLERAAAAYEELGLRFDRARTLLALGRTQRRFRKWGAARRSLEQASAAFDGIGSDGWAGQARAELNRVGARKPRAAGELTPSEQRVVELAAAGKSNKEIAQELVVGVHTVEVHLSHAYAKLGVRSRGQLAGRLSGTTTEPPKV